MSTRTDIIPRLQRVAAKYPLSFIGIMVVVFFAPFLTKPLHIDDPLFVWSAQHISSQPGNFYGFDVDWTGYTVPMSVENRNPPVNGYFLAAVGPVFGWSEIVLHAAMLLFTFAAVAGMYQLAQRWCERPMLATLIGLSTPVFMVSATSLMCDVPTLAMVVWTMVFWERALKNSKAVDYLAAAFLAGFSVLTKYSALTLLPLLPILALLRKKNLGLWLPWLAIPAGMISLFQLWTAGLYGTGLISSAAGFASNTHFQTSGGLTNKIITGVAYAGACLLPVLFFLPSLWTKRELIIVTGILAVAATAVVESAGANVEQGWGFRVQLWLWVVAGIHLMLMTARALWQQRDTVSLLLGLWLAAGFIFAAVLNWTVSARSFLPLVPAAAILVVRSLPRSGTRSAKSGNYVLPVALSAMFSVVLAVADYAAASSARRAAEFVATQYPPGENQVWFEGHWGFQYYLQRAGAKPVDFSSSILSPGDILVVPANNSNIIPPDTSTNDVTTIGTREFPEFSWLSTMNNETGAGFYGEGLLPFVFGPVPAKKCSVYRVEKILKPPYFVWLAWQTPKVPVEVLNNLAWALATSENAGDRDGERAVLFAKRACKLTGYHETMMVGTLGAAYAEAGRFDDAIATAQKACDMAAAAGKTELLKSNQQLLELYRQHQPYHEENKP